jgi:hypothetical protein
MDSNNRVNLELAGYIMTWVRWTKFKTILLVSIFLTVGCKDRKTVKPEKSPSLLMMYSNRDNALLIAQRLKKKCAVYAGDSKEFLLEKLRDIYNDETHHALLMPLLDEFKDNQELLDVVYEYYRQHPVKWFPKKFFAKLLTKDKQFTGMLDIYLASGVYEHANQLVGFFRDRKRLTAHELVQFCELLLLTGEFGRVKLYMAKCLPRFRGGMKDRATLLLGKVAFYNREFKEALPYFISLFKGQMKDRVVHYLVDSLVMMGQNQKASKLVKVYSMAKFESAEVHLLRAKVALFSKNVEQSKRAWDIAKKLGAHGEDSEILAFFLSVYFPTAFTGKELGRFQLWQSGSRPQISTRHIEFYRDEIYVKQYEKLAKHDPELLQKLQSGIKLASSKQGVIKN